MTYFPLKILKMSRDGVSLDTPTSLSSFYFFLQNFRNNIAVYLTFCDPNKLHATRRLYFPLFTRSLLIPESIIRVSRGESFPHPRAGTREVIRSLRIRAASVPRAAEKKV